MANGLADWAASHAHTAANLSSREAYLSYLDCKRAGDLLTDINLLILDILEEDALMRKRKASLCKQLLGITSPDTKIAKLFA